MALEQRVREEQAAEPRALVPARLMRLDRDGATDAVDAPSELRFQTYPFGVLLGRLRARQSLPEGEGSTATSS